MHDSTASGAASVGAKRVVGMGAEVLTALDTPIESLEDDVAYHPEVLDVRGAIAALPDAERAEMADEAIPSFGQVWALGFMFAVEAWPDEWAEPYRLL